jgi:predicted nucleotidyltransferase
VTPHAFTGADIRRLFDLLNAELAATGVHGELYLVGGAVMCLAFAARESTRDVDAVFRPAAAVRQAAVRVAAKAHVPETWLNDAVKAWLGGRGDFDRYLELSHLNVFIARAEYLLALKCAAMRLGEEFRDLDDVRYLLRHLNITSSGEALEIVSRYVNEDDVPVKTRLALEELLGA